MSARISRLAARLDTEWSGEDVALVDATHDSREVRAGWLFCAVPGQLHDGHDHAAEAVRRGAAALLVERRLDLDVPQLVVPSVRASLGPAAATVHGDPAAELTMLGVTGTNGKTTVTFLLEAALSAAGRGSGRIGTLGARLHGRSEPGVRTTPEATDLQRLLRSMRERGADGIAMEVSSHGLDLHRVDGMVLDVVAFTNLSQDHLDWHGTMARYLAAKARLFTPELAAHGVVLVDAPGADDLLAAARIPVTTVGERVGVDVLVSDRRVGHDGSRARLRFDDVSIEVETVMRGAYNLDNAILAVVTGIRAGLDHAAVLAGIAATVAPPGRLEPYGGGAEPLVLVDYAHTPDAVRQVVAVGRGLLGAQGRLHVVLGAGGDRDREKRGPMGAAACGADVVVVTDDNPRGEDPAAIRRAVADGAVGACGTERVEIVAGRPDAIARAVGAADAGDVVLVLGRGHEAHQEIAGAKVPMDDRELVRAALRERAPSGSIDGAERHA